MPRCQFGPGHGRPYRFSTIEVRRAPHRNRFSPLGCSVMESPRGLNQWVCARWCPTLPHPGGCSTIGAVRLSFRVRNGSGRLPVAMTTETTTRAARFTVVVCVLDTIRLSVPSRLPTTLSAWWGGRVGCGPYSGRSRLPYCSPPTHTVRVWGCCCLYRLISTSQLQTVTGLPLLAYQPSHLLGAYQKRQVLPAETLS